MGYGGPTVFNSTMGGGGDSSGFTYVDWASSTPTFSNLGSMTEVTFFQKREGSDLLLRGKARCGTVTSSTASMTLPGGLELDFTKFSEANLNWLGEGQRIQAGGAAINTNDRFLLFSDQLSTTSIFFGFFTGSNTINKANGNTIFGSNNYMVIDLRCPISGW